MAPKTRFFGQMALGLSVNPLRASTVAPNAVALRKISGSPVFSQVIDYVTLGTELSERVSFLATLPVALLQGGTDPSPGLGGGQGYGVSLANVAANDMRIDARVIAFRSDDRRLSIGAGLSFWAPIGDSFSFGSDQATSTALTGSIEGYVRQFIVTGNMGVHFRPLGNLGGLAVGSELTFAVGAFLPMRDGRVRVGGELFGSTGLETLQNGVGARYSTFFAGKNTPLEWMAEGRMFLDDRKQIWGGAGLGTRLDAGYGAPDVWMMSSVDYCYGIQDSDATSPNGRMKMIRERIAKEGADADHDGIPDEVDLCPSIPEDHLEPDPTDGCPKPSDRDNDGIPDDQDKCPDVPEDKDGIDDYDGCPEDDFDKDGILDVSDACPREPGDPSPDPKANGCPQFIKRVTGSTEIEILKQVQFDTGRASIKATSYPILDEIVKLLKANTDIKRLSVEGHTDNRGALDMNSKLSQDRADSVMAYVTSHGIAADRLEAHGFGPARPLDSNETELGRQKNRRVEFHILQQGKPTEEGAQPAQGQTKEPSAP
jgi:outer membrane protein OmpA-like peptidoglycan-associated protein